MKEISAFGCDNCGMTSRHKRSVLRHEANTCKNNLDRKRCGLCKHFLEDWDTVYNPYHGGDPGSTDYEVLVYRCERKEIEIQHPNINTDCKEFELTNQPKGD